MTKRVSQGKIEWLDLEITQWPDGSFVGYESLTDARCEGTWDEVRRWIDYLLADTEDAVKGIALEDK